MSCGETYQERLDRNYATKMADIKKELETASLNAKAIEEIFNICLTDIKEYLVHPKEPYLRSCLDYQTELKHGIEDRQARDACHDDMIEEIPSCQRWKKAQNAEIDRLQTMNRLNSF